MSVRYQRDSRGLAALLMHPDMDRAMGVVAAVGEATFETIAPRRSSRYATSLTQTGVVSPLPTPRRARRLTAMTEYAAQVERRRGTLARVADLIGSPAAGE